MLVQSYSLNFYELAFAISCKYLQFLGFVKLYWFHLIVFLYIILI